MWGDGKTEEICANIKAPGLDDADILFVPTKAKVRGREGGVGAPLIFLLADSFEQEIAESLEGLRKICQLIWSKGG